MTARSPAPDAASRHASAPRPRIHGITPRALIIGILLIPVMCIWNEYTEIVAQATDLVAMSLPIAVIFALVVLIAANLFLKRWLPRLALTQAELLYIFVMQTVSIGISGIGMMQFLATMVGNVFYYATPENQWQQKFGPYLKSWLLPDPKILKGFYVGRSSFLDAAIIRGWITPILVWSAFIVVLLGVMLCLNVIIRKQWMDRERLSFPITILPIELTRSGGATEMLASRALWAGFGLAAVLECLASLNYLYPSVPFLPIKPSDPRLDLTSVFDSSPPWNGIGYFVLSFYPLVIGLTYFLPLDVGFSLWFFYLFSKAQNVLATALGYHDPGASMSVSRMPYAGEQSAGAFIGLAVLALWAMRGHLREVLAEALNRRSSASDRGADADEPMPYRAAILGVILGGAALTAFGIAIGMVWYVPVVFFGLYYLFVITFTRIRAEAGLPWGYGPDMNVHATMLSGAGVKSFNAPTLTGLAFVLWFDLDYRCAAMPHQLEGMKYAESGRMNNRHLVYVILLATAIGALASWWAILTCYYQYGAATAHVNGWRTYMGTVPWHSLDDWLANPLKQDMPRIEGLGVGVAATAFLVYMRSRFPWFPFHPVGYAVAGTSAMPWLWCATLVGWTIKAITIRFGGMRGYRRGIPFFIGFILGDYVAGSLWAIYGSVTGVTTYRAFPI